MEIGIPEAWCCPPAYASVVQIRDYSIMAELPAKDEYEQYLAKYVSKSEPSFNTDLPNNASDTQKYLRTEMIGSVEAIEVLVSFHQTK